MLVENVLRIPRRLGGTWPDGVNVDPRMNLHAGFVALFHQIVKRIEAVRYGGKRPFPFGAALKASR